MFPTSMLALVLVCAFTQHCDASTTSNISTTSVDSTLEDYWESVADNEQAQVDIISRLLAHLLTSRDVTDVNAYWRFRSRQAVADLQTAVDAQERALNEIRNDVTSLQRAKNKLKADVEEVKGTVTRSTYIRWGRTACAGNSTLLYKGKHVTILRKISTIIAAGGIINLSLF